MGHYYGDLLWDFNGFTSMDFNHMRLRCLQLLFIAGVHQRFHQNHRSRKSDSPKLGSARPQQDQYPLVIKARSVPSGNQTWFAGKSPI